MYKRTTLVANVVGTPLSCETELIEGVVNVIGRAVASEHVRALVADVGDFNGYGVGHLMLNRGVPRIQRQADVGTWDGCEVARTAECSGLLR